MKKKKIQFEREDALECDLTVREYFAVLMMQAHTSNPMSALTTPVALAKMAVISTDALLLELYKRRR